ncbi:MAG: DMT family transporter [Dysgonamonadaceae bacterium]|nr:DMT family transporter [Dysgonamonadaceae bacterium]MDD4727132.1 DMT family transporter [Dysgonamonadaceae bacterium]
MKDTSKSFIYVLIAVVSWSTVATAFKIGLRHYSHYELLLVSAISALLIFGLLISFQKKWGLIRSITHKEWGLFAITGLLSPAGYYLILFKAYELLPAQIAQSINYSWAIVLTLLLAVFMKQRIPALKFLGMAISLGGVALISLGSESLSGVQLSITGLFLAFISAFVWASFWILNKKSEHIDNVLSLFVSFFFGSIYLIMGSLFVDVQLQSLKGALSSLYVGLFEMAIPFIFFGLALKKTDNPALINQLCYLSPFISLFIIQSVLGESIYLTTIIGLLLIIGGILFNEYVLGKKHK